MNNQATGIKRIMPRKFVRNLEDYGTRIAFQKSLKYLTRPIYNEIEFILYEIDLSKAEGKEIINRNLEFKLIDINDHDSICQIEEMEEWLKGELKTKLESNGICMVVLDDNKLAGFNLATTGAGYITLLKLKIATDPVEAWSEHIAIHKNYRGRKLANDLRNSFYSELQKTGIKALYGHRQEFNVASRGSAKKYTAQEIGKATYRNFVGFDRLVFDKNNAFGNSKISIDGNSEDKRYPFSVHINHLKG